MRRAIIATAGTVIGLAALLSYKSSGTVQLNKVAVSPAGSSSGGSTSGGGSGSSGSSQASEHTYVGQDVSYRYGSIQVDVTIKGSKIVDITVPENGAVDPHSAMINSESVPVLVQEAEKAQGLDFDAVSGATYTSDAFAQSLQSALSQVKR